MNYFTSDIHFSDLATFINDDRPFENLKEYDEFIIKLWNKTMTKNDTLYIVGDMLDCDGPDFDSWKSALKYVKRIKPQIILIMGNNEDRIVNNFFDGDFQKFRQHLISAGVKDVHKNFHLNIRGINLYMTHNPVDHKKGYVNLVGHSHRSKGLWYSFGLSVSCDLNHFRPYSEESLIFQLKRKDEFFSDPIFRLI